MTTPTLSITPEQIEAGIGVICAIGDTIRDLGSVPSGHLYARVVSHMNLGEYERIIDILCKASLVRQDVDHLLTWIGPKAGQV